MSVGKPGQLRCPTCHRSTPAAPFCTKCGSPIPPGVRNRPRGLDREELQARIRARRSGQSGFRRGTPPPVQPEDQPGGDVEPLPYEADGADAEPDDFDPTVDAPDDDEETARHWREPPPPQPPRRPLYAADAAPPPPTVVGGYDAEQDQVEPTARYERPPEYDFRRRPQPRRTSAAPFLVVGLVVLGALALFGGAALAGMLGRPQTAAQPTPTPALTLAATPAASVAPTPAPGTSASPGASAGPGATQIAFPDGFTVSAEPCLGEPVSQECPSSGQAVRPSDGAVWILVEFEQASGEDVIGFQVRNPAGESLHDGSIALSEIGCRAVCNGWSKFSFRVADQAAGDYQVTITRNGEPAAVTGFSVEG